MRVRHVRKTEELVSTNVVCAFCLDKDSCNIAEDNIVFCTKFKKGMVPIEHLVDFYECKQGHRFGVDHNRDSFRKNSIPCPVCRDPAFFKEVSKFEVKNSKIALRQFMRHDKRKTVT